MSSIEALLQTVTGSGAIITASYNAGRRSCHSCKVMKAATVAFAFVGFFVHTSPAGAAASDWTLKSSSRMDPELVQICLYRDRATAGFFSPGKWKASIGEVAPEGCAEWLGADLVNQVLVVSVPGFSQPGGYLAGRADAYCPENQVPHEYSACTSSFFGTSSDSANYRIFHSSAVGAIGEEAGLFITLEKMRADNMAEAPRKEREAYLRAFENATTLSAMAQFEKTYQGHDPDRLIETLAPKKEALQRTRQRELYASAKTAKDYGAFIAEYATSDLEKLTPSAKTKLADAERREVMESESLKKRAELVEFERQIRYCASMTARAQDAIERENKIAQVSGYVNKSILRQAGETIVMCREHNPKIYAEYRKKGGLKTLAAIGNGE
nr:hypothetical protein [uncultured Duganella sp.]